MADQTQLTPADLRSSADRIGNIMSDEVMGVFTAMPGDAPTAGNFPTGQWLHDRATDRIKAIQQQAQVLKSAFGDICSGLHKVADSVEGTDGNNARNIK